MSATEHPESPEHPEHREHREHREHPQESENPDRLSAGLPLRRSLLLLLLVAAGALLVPLLGPVAALHGTGEAAAPALREVGVLRGVLFCALCVHVGELFAAGLARGLPGAPPGVPPRPLAPAAALVGTGAAFGLALLVSTGNLVPGSLAELDLGGLIQSRDGLLALVEVNAFALAGLCALTRRRWTAVPPLAVLVGAEALRAHPEPYSPLFGSALTLVHLSCAALWAGGLLAVLRTLRRWPAVPGGLLLARYARLAAYLLAALTATGVVSGLRRMPRATVLDQLTTTGYGRTLLAKLLLVVAVTALAWTARRRARRGDPATAGDRAAVPARGELTVLAAVLLVSALLTALPLPIRW